MKLKQGPKRTKTLFLSISSNILNLYTYNNEEFWNLLKQIKSTEYQTLPYLNDLDKHYKNLLQKDCNLTKQDLPKSLNTKPIDSLN